jgi:outer membrane protein assembly factor BamD
MKNIIFIALATIILSSCANNQPTKSQTLKKESNDRAVFNNIYKNLSSNLDLADQEYVKLKTDYENSNYLSKAALALAIAHINKKEHILANFYLQEVLSNDSSNSFAKYLLSKNQYMYAKLMQRDQQYLNRAINSLKTNKNLLNDSDYLLLANTMYTRVMLEKIWNNVKIGSMYKKLNKNKAYELYINKTLNSGIDIKDIYKP